MKDDATCDACVRMPECMRRMRAYAWVHACVCLGACDMPRMRAYAWMHERTQTRTNRLHRPPTRGSLPYIHYYYIYTTTSMRAYAWADFCWARCCWEHLRKQTYPPPPRPGAYSYMCPHTTIYLAAPCKHVCSTTVHVSLDSYYCTCVLRLLYLSAYY